MIIDKLFESVKNKGHVCLGLDTSVDYIPKDFANKYSTPGEAVFQFNKRIIDATLDITACYKVQIAYYEALGLDGLTAYKQTLKYLKSSGAIVIGDVKRGDISKTAEMYAKAHFEGDFESDFITLSPYMGMDSISPYLSYVKNSEKGLFVLLRTSNSGAKDIQYMDDSEGNKIYTRVGDLIYNLSKDYAGSCGYSSIGAVMGCTHTDEIEFLRERYKNLFALIPGYGAQGGTAEDVAKFLKDDNGGVVNSSRGILLGYKNYEDGENKFHICAREEVLKMRGAILNAAKIC